MIPKTNNIDLTIKTMPSKTYDLNTGQIIDEIESLKQAIFLMLSTARYKHIIYSWRYGGEFVGLIGKDMDYIKLELKRRIKEALTIDDRVKSATDFKFEHNDDDLLVSFTVNSIYGQIKANKAVTV